MNVPKKYRIYHMDSDLGATNKDFGFSLGEAITYFSYFPFVSSDKRKLLLELIDPKSEKHTPEKLQENLNFHCDIIASMCAQLVFRKFLGESFTTKILQFFDRAMKGYGFKLSPFSDLKDPKGQKELVDSTARHTILIPGCQNDQVRNARVDGAFELSRVLAMGQHKPTMLFSGLHCPPTEFPEERYPEEFQEARSMKCYFVDLLEDAGIDREDWPEIRVEESSSRTLENLQNSLQEMRASGEDELDYHLWISSSTFHLPRLARLTLDLIEKNDLKYIKKLTLISPEQGASSLALHQTYAKQMMFELFTTFFEVFKKSQNMADLFAIRRPTKF